MHQIKLKIVMFFSLLAIFSIVSAQDLETPVTSNKLKARSTESTGNYDNDLGQIHGVIISVQFRENICSKHFPELSEMLRAAHISWRDKNLTFIQEMEKAFQDRLWQSVGDNRKEFLLLRKELADAEVEYQAGLEEVLLSDGEEELRLQCESFSDFLSSDVMDIENFLVEQIRVVRKGPPVEKHK